jgi:hypothetical protein
MRVRRSSVVLLLAGALPLLAENTIPLHEQKTQVTVDGAENDVVRAVVDDPENDSFVPLTAVKAIHHDSLYRLPSLPKDPVTAGKDPLTDVPQKSDDKETMSQNAPVDTEEVRSTATQSSESNEREPENGDVATETNIVQSDTQNTSIVQPSIGGEIEVEPISTSTGNDAQSINATENKVAQDKSMDGGGDGEDSKQDVASDDYAETVEANITTPKVDQAKSSHVDKEPAAEDDLTARVAVDYASKSAGALILEKSSTFKGTSNILNGDLDKYAIAPCEDKRFVVIGLSEDILVKKVIIANYERFTSWVKDFQIMGSQTMGTWVDLGTYTAKSGNGEQTFDLIEPAWARYLKIKFLTHHGSEYYCTVSQIQVQGSTMLQGFHEQWEENDEDEEVGEALEEVEGDSIEAVIAAKTNSTQDEAIDAASIDAGNHTQHDANNESSAHPEKSGKNSTIPDDSLLKATDAPQPVSVPSPFFETFKSSDTLNDMLQGNVETEELFSTIYNLIPSTMSHLPTVSRDSPGRLAESDMHTSLHEIGTAAIQSLWSSSLLASHSAKTLVAESSGTIVAPKMTDSVEEVIRRVKTTMIAKDSLDSATDTLESVQEATSDVIDSENEVKATESRKDKEPKAAIIPSDEAETESKDVSDKRQTAEESKPTVSVGDVKPRVEKSKDPKDVGHQAASSSQDAKSDSAVSEAARVEAHTMDLTLARMLERLPSSDCLRELNFSDFKEKIAASRKGVSGNGDKAHSGSTMEPIFKKLTDEIKSLQMSLSVHDQFTKSSVSCYQRVMLDLIVEMESMRNTNEARLLRLEKEVLGSSWSSSLLSALSTWAARALSLFYFLAKWHLQVLLSRATKAARYFIFLWPNVKAMPSTEIGTQLSAYLVPALAWFDRLHEELGTYDLGFLDEGSKTAWLPVFPLLLFLICCRLLMLLTTKTNATIRIGRSTYLKPRKPRTPETDRKMKPRTSDKDPPISKLADDKRDFTTTFKEDRQMKPRTSEKDPPIPKLADSK